MNDVLIKFIHVVYHKDKMQQQLDKKQLGIRGKSKQQQLCNQHQMGLQANPIQQP